MDFAAAVAIAARAYGASRDHSGGLLLVHAVNVAQALGRSATPNALNAAVLHDVLEDTDWSADDLVQQGVDSVVCEVVGLLTRRTGETYVDYIRRICDAPGLAGDTARIVKVADLTVSVDRADSDTLRARYEQSLPLLRGALAPAVS